MVHNALVIRMSVARSPFPVSHQVVCFFCAEQDVSSRTPAWQDQTDADCHTPSYGLFAIEGDGMQDITIDCGWKIA